MKIYLIYEDVKLGKLMDIFEMRTRVWQGCLLSPLSTDLILTIDRIKMMTIATTRIIYSITSDKRACQSELC